MTSRHTIRMFSPEGWGRTQRRSLPLTRKLARESK